MAERPHYKALVVREPQGPNGKPFFYEVGAAWQSEKGTVTVRFHPNIAVSNSIVLVPSKDEEPAPETPAETGRRATRRGVAPR